MSNAEPSYSIKVYGSQRLGNRPKYSHTFATFTEQQMAADGSVVRRCVTISWLPKDGDIEPLGPPKPGRNYGLDETFTWLDQAGSNIRWESPETEIEPRLFESAVIRFGELGQGILQYVMIDSFQTRPHQASNCIHAVTDLPLTLEGLGMAYTGVLHGIGASRFAYHYLSPFYVNPPQISAEDERLFERHERHHFRVAMMMESLQTAGQNMESGGPQ